VQFLELHKLRDLNLDLVSYFTYVVEVYAHTKLDQNRKNFLWMDGQTDGQWTRLPIVDLLGHCLGDDLKILKEVALAFLQDRSVKFQLIYSLLQEIPHSQVQVSETSYQHHLQLRHRLILLQITRRHKRGHKITTIVHY